MSNENTGATITIRIDPAEKEVLQDYAKEEGLTLSQVIRKAIKEYIAEQIL